MSFEDPTVNNHLSYVRSHLIPRITLVPPNGSGKNSSITWYSGRVSKTPLHVPELLSVIPLLKRTLTMLVLDIASPNWATTCFEIKLCVAPESINTTTLAPPMLPLIFIVCGDLSPLTEFNDTSTISRWVWSGVSYSSSLTSLSTISIWSVLLGHRCPGANFPSHLK